MPLDGDLTTLHIRCGSDIEQSLRQAGFGGDFLEYSDPVCEGPVLDTSGLLEVRARYIAGSYGSALAITHEQIRVRLAEAERRLCAAHAYQRVVFWFEHDSYDQLLLARCLSHFAGAPRPKQLELICIDRHPSVERFIGLGQLRPVDLAGLWPDRKAVTADQIELGRTIWKALRSPDPSDLTAIAGTGTSALPIAAPALRRHLQELPGQADGLSLTQRQVLRILAGKPTEIGRIFSAFQGGVEPLPFLGDLGVLGAVERLALSNPPILTIEPDEKPFLRVASMTETGCQVLAGTTDYLTLRPPERWVGGVIVDGAWRWGESGLIGG